MTNKFYAITLYIKHKLFQKGKSGLNFNRDFPLFAAILLSQFSPYPGITIATDDVITTTDDVITTTDDVYNTHNLHRFQGESI